MSDVYDANVSQDSSITLGGGIVCDGYADECPAAVITHAHGDHYWGLDKLLLSCENIFMSRATRDLLIAQKPALDIRRNIKPLEFGSEVKVDRYKLRILPVKHILGSSQVIIQDVDASKRLAYSGDFLMPGTQPVEADTLVVDATYGNPTRVRNFDRKEIELDVSPYVQSRLLCNEKVTRCSRHEDILT